jgi:hypothetical protein
MELIIVALLVSVIAMGFFIQLNDLNRSGKITYFLCATLFIWATLTMTYKMGSIEGHRQSTHYLKTGELPKGSSYRIIWHNFNKNSYVLYNK